MSHTKQIAVAGVVLILSMALRLVLLDSDMVIDEITSVRIASDFDHCLQSFTNRIDNNHPLNSFYLAIVGQQAENWQLRLHSFVSGLLIIGIAALWGANYNRSSMWTCAVSSALSPLLIVRSCNARGYIHVLMFSLLAWLAFDKSRQSEDHRLFWALALLPISVLGFLSHAIFVHTLGGLLIGQVCLLFLNRDNMARELKIAAVRFFPALMFLAGYYLFHLSKLTVIGGPRHSVATLIMESVTNSVFLSSNLLALVPTLFIAHLAMVWKQSNPDRKRSIPACIALGSVLLSPVLVVLVANPRVLMSNYFLVGQFFTLMVLSLLLGDIFEKPDKKKHAIALAVIWLCLQSYTYMTVFRLRFSPFRRAVQAILDNEQAHSGPIYAHFYGASRYSTRFKHPPKRFDQILWLPDLPSNTKNQASPPAKPRQPLYILAYIDKGRAQQKIQINDLTYLFVRCVDGSPFTEGDVSIFKAEQ